MKNYVVSLLIAILFGCQSVPEAETKTKGELAQNSAYCYVAHKVMNSHQYKNNETNKYVDLIVDLIGKDKVNLKINIAKRRYDIRSTETMRNAESEMKRYCPMIDKLIIESNT